MSLAIGFLIIFLLAVPGIVFRVTYLSSPYSKRNINTTTLEEIYSSLIPAFIFHSISILILTSFGKTINYQFIFNLLIGNNTARDINNLNGYLTNFLIYMAANTVANFVFALLLRYCVLKFKLYKHYPVLSIYNKWYDILKPKSTKNEKNSVWLDILLETRNDVLIYRGFLTDFWLDKDGGIKELHLEDVRRRVMSKDLKLGTDDALYSVAAAEPATGSRPDSPDESRPGAPDESRPVSTDASKTGSAASSGTESGNASETQPLQSGTGIEEPMYEPLITESIDERYYYIPGERFIIKYEDVKNMNITYYSEEII